MRIDFNNFELNARTLAAPPFRTSRRRACIIIDQLPLPADAPATAEAEQVLRFRQPLHYLTRVNGSHTLPRMPKSALLLAAPQAGLLLAGGVLMHVLKLPGEQALRRTAADS